MSYRRAFAKSFLAATALAAFASPASAQRIDRIVAFGDSYADDGNFFQFVGINPATTVAYTTGRFSGGTNYIDTLGQILDVPIDNFAIGGALTYQFNTNTGPNLGFPTEYGSFLTGGAGATPFPAVSGTFDEGDLLAISIGGNDARIYQTGSVPLGIPVGTLIGAPGAGAASAAFATAGLDLLVAAGAPTISYLAGNTANIPEVQYHGQSGHRFAVRNAFFRASTRRCAARWRAIRRRGGGPLHRPQSDPRPHPGGLWRLRSDRPRLPAVRGQHGVHHRRRVASQYWSTATSCI